MLGIELTPEHDVHRLVDLGVRAEAAGYDAVYSTCHYNNRDPWALLSQLATATESVRLGPGVANPYETHPVTLASRVATLDEFSGGRAIFGIGPGDPSTLRNLGLSDERGLRPVLEAFETARKLWTGERVDHEGTFVASEAGLNYEPPQGADIPVHVGGEGPHMCRMAAKHADGLLFNGSHPADLAWAREQVDDGLADRPGSRGEFDLIAYAAVSIAEDEAAAREAARPPVAFIAGGAARPVLDRHGIDPEAASAIGDRVSAGEFSAAFERVTPTMIDAFCMAGSPETVRERAAAVAEHADGLVVGSPLGPDLEAAVDLTADAVADRF
ncbi:5,10-methylenetetrahydromethanopterin reductase [Halorubrum sp. CBA1125]|uniref:5,10-methylenetetrahydromethanopterin reductase n=1 Tax=Halorubrum sp. CBA1125 TaxID=2668072 RepID=UPI0012E86126|nr:5,10-methylenetetrahydromethanopterin reductase [Halorubrum sp. CBA1125]MUW15204.1 5,10-methylenetetrahydromethanopterin reductase [Halorubrum sp. CBA1125]